MEKYKRKFAEAEKFWYDNIINQLKKNIEDVLSWNEDNKIHYTTSIPLNDWMKIKRDRHGHEYYSVISKRLQKLFKGENIIVKPTTTPGKVGIYIKR